MSENIDEKVLEILITILKTHNDILQKAPVTILLVDRNGKILSANHAAKRSVGFDPIGRNIYDIFDRKVADRRMCNAVKAIDRGEIVVDRDRRDFRHFLTYYRPLSPLDVCVVMATEITEEVRIQNALRVVQEIRNTLVSTRDPELYAEKVGSPLLGIEGVTHVKVILLKRDISSRRRQQIVWQGGRPTGKYRMHFPLTVLDEKVGDVALSLEREMSDEEVTILQTGLDDVAYSIKLSEMREMLAHNIVEMARIIDGIRNPLTAILLNTEMHCEGVHEKVKVQVERITGLLKSLDEKWIESEKIISFLRAAARRQ